MKEAIQATPQVTTQNPSSLFQAGGICAVLVGICSAISYILYLLLPEQQKLGAKGPDLLPSFAQNPTILTLEFIGLALVGLFGLGAVMAISQAVAAQNGWVRWTSALAYLGYGVLAVSQLLTLERLPRVADAFVAGDAATKAALAAVWKSSLDPQTWLQYGGVGLWIVIISLLAVRTNAFPKLLAYLGLLVGIVHCLLPVMFVLQAPAFIVPLAAVGLIVIPVWYIWVGITLQRSAGRA